jgi:hypothetical protein
VQTAVPGSQLSANQSPLGQPSQPAAKRRTVDAALGKP